jgi:hypothetical protein
MNNSNPNSRNIISNPKEMQKPINHVKEKSFQTALKAIAK